MAPIDKLLINTIGCEEVNSQSIGRSKHEIFRITVVVSTIIVIVVAAVVGGLFLFRSNTNAVVKSSLMPQNTDYSVFQPIANFGNGTWQFEENNLHVYNYTYSGAVASFNTTVDGTVIVPPTVCDGLLLVDLTGVMSGGSGAGGVAAINLQNGQAVWNVTVPNGMMSQPITYEGLVIIGLGLGTFRSLVTNATSTVRGGGTNYVAALNFSTGQTVWTFPTLGEDMPTPVIYNNLIVFPNGNGVVYALNAVTGQEVWKTSLQTGQYMSMSCPAIDGNLIFFGSGNPYAFYCVNLADGKVSWSTPIVAPDGARVGGVDDCSPVIWNDAVISGYTITMSNGLLEPVLFAANETNGQILWQVNENVGPQPAGGEWFTPVTVWNGVVYNDSPENGTLYAVNASSGAVLWAFSTGKATCNVNVYDGNLWIVNSSGTVFVLNPQGALLNSTNVGLGVVDGNLIFVGQNVIIYGNSRVISMPVSDIYPIA